VTSLKWKLISVHLEIVLILTEDRCTICVELTIGSEIGSDAPDETSRTHAEGTIGLDVILDTPDGTPRSRGSREARFVTFGDSAKLDVR
jgi:hypothetical protein